LPRQGANPNWGYRFFTCCIKGFNNNFHFMLIKLIQDQFKIR